MPGMWHKINILNRYVNNRKEFDFGKQRCIKRFNQKTECLLDDMLKWKDVLDTVREEMRIDLSIRQND